MSTTQNNSTIYDNNNKIDDTDLQLFFILDEVVKRNKLFTNKDFNVSKLSISLNTNSTYISRAIKSSSYKNFIPMSMFYG